MNELASIFDRLGIRTHDVLAAASTKWNFLPFTPGLVGGHCIGVDPYYLTKKAEEVGYHPQVILAGRRINDDMGVYIAQRMVKILIQADIPVKGARIAILGITFKENVSDLPDIVAELHQFGIEPFVHDPLANSYEVQNEYGIRLADWNDMSNLDGVVLAVSHKFYLEMPRKALLSCVRSGGVLIDVKSIIDPSTLPQQIHYWSL